MESGSGEVGVEKGEEVSGEGKGRGSGGIRRLGRGAEKRRQAGAEVERVG